MGRLTLKVVRAVKISPLSEEEILTAIATAEEAKTEPEPVRKRRTYRRRDMQAEA